MKIETLENPPLPLLFGKSGEPRGEGLHISEVIHRYNDFIRSMTTFGKAKKEKESNWSTPELFNAGFVWEEAMELAFKLRSRGIQRPLEINHKGILMSPDGYDPHESRVHEYKFTWKSMRELTPADNPVWLAQIKSYCLALNALKARFWVCYANGDYSKFSGPRLRVYDLEFTQDELNANWDYLMAFAKREGLLAPPVPKSHKPQPPRKTAQ